MYKIWEIKKKIKKKRKEKREKKEKYFQIVPDMKN